MKVKVSLYVFTLVKAVFLNGGFYMANLFVDVASYQSDDISFFNTLKSKGIKGACIKVTEGCQHGTNYINPKWQKQLECCKKTGLVPSFYHFAHCNGVKDCECEADFFINQLEKAKIDRSHVLALDFETSTCTVANCNAFLNRCKKRGWNNLVTYTYRNLYDTRLKDKGLITGYNWIADYSNNKPVNCGAWQFTNNWNGLHVDCSYDYTGFMTTSHQSKPVSKPVSNNPQWRTEHGIFTLDAGQSIRLRTLPKMNANTIAVLYGGQSVKYDAWCITDNHVWIRQPRGNGNYGYLPTGEAKNGKRVNYWGKFK